MRWTFALVSVLASCGGDDDCEIQPLPSCPDCGAGEIRYALAIEGVPSIAAFEGDVAVGCNGQVALFDETLEPTGSIELVSQTSQPAQATVAAGGDSLYVVQADPSRAPGEEASSVIATLRAFSWDGSERWHAELGRTFGVQLSAGPEGAYAMSLDSEVVTAFAAADGGLRWEAGRPDKLGTDGAGNAVLVGNPEANGTIVVRSVDARGVERWSRTWTVMGSTEVDPKFMLFDAIARGTGDTVVVSGIFDAPGLDLGDATIVRPAEFTEPRTSFVAVLEPDGRTRWALPLANGTTTNSLSLVLGEQIIVAGSWFGNGAGLGVATSETVDGYVAVLTAEGVARVHHIGGPGNQRVVGLERGANGTVVVAFENAANNLGDGVTMFGGRAFTTDGTQRIVASFVP